MIVIDAIFVVRLLGLLYGKSIVSSIVAMLVRMILAVMCRARFPGPQQKEKGSQVTTYYSVACWFNT